MAIADKIYEEKGLEPISGVYDPGISVPSYENEVSESSAGAFSFLGFPWVCCIGFPFITIIAGIIISLFKRRCPRCRKLKLRTKTTILKKAKRSSSSWGGGGSSGGSRSSGGGFGGFGGGSSGGGGASRGW